MRRRIYRYGAGTFPPRLAGRGTYVAGWSRMLDEVSVDGRAVATDTLLTGPRGVGKTCLMQAFSEEARSRGFEILDVQAIGQPTLVNSLLRQADRALTEDRGGWERARNAFQRFAGFQLGGVGVTFQPVPPDQARGLDPESLAEAIAELANAMRERSPARTGGVMLAVDELQLVVADEAGLLAAALQNLNKHHREAPVVVAATGLPHTMSYLATRTPVTHPDRLLTERRIPLLLSVDDAREAITEPALGAGVAWDPRAVDEVVQISNAYPAHIQFFADAVWNAGEGPRIELSDTQRALPHAIEDLVERTLDPQWTRLTPRERELVTAVAVLGGQAQVGELETLLGRQAKSWSAARDTTIDKGDLYSPGRGRIVITNPAMAKYALQHYPATVDSSNVALATMQTLIDAAAGLDTTALDGPDVPAPIDPPAISASQRERRQPPAPPTGAPGPAR